MRRNQEPVVAGNRDEVVGFECEGTREMNCVVGAKPMGVSEIRGSSNEDLVDLDEIELLEQAIELVDQPARSCPWEPTGADRLTERRAP